MDAAVNFCRAARENEVVIMRELLGQGLRVNAFDPCTGRNALHEASATGSEKVLRLLFEKEVDINSRTFLGRESGLHLAAFNGHARCCRLLARRGCEVSNLNNAGNAPLHLASTKECVAALVRNGADPFQRNKAGQSPVDTASSILVRQAIEVAQQEEHRAYLKWQREKRMIHEAAQKELVLKEKAKLLEEEKRRMKREYLAFRNSGAEKKQSKSVFAGAVKKFDYEKRIGFN